MDKRQEVESVELTKTIGLLQAEIVAGRLRSEGIPVWTWQEGAGKAQGLFVGALGAGHVMVPPSYVQRAAEVLIDPPIPIEMDEVVDSKKAEEEGYREFSLLSKLILLLLAYYQSKLIVIGIILIALLDRWVSQSQAVKVQCPNCGEDVELDDAELEAGKYVCPFCDAAVNLNLDQ